MGKRESNLYLLPSKLGPRWLACYRLLLLSESVCDSQLPRSLGFLLYPQKNPVGNSCDENWDGSSCDFLARQSLAVYRVVWMGPAGGELHMLEQCRAKIRPLKNLRALYGAMCLNPAKNWMLFFCENAFILRGKYYFNETNGKNWPNYRFCKKQNR